MKKILAFLLLIIMLTGCAEKIEPVADVSHELMGGVSITIPEGTGKLAQAIYEATDYVVNTVVNKHAKRKPEFISFEFSSDVLLSLSEKETLKSLFSCYGVEITEGLRSDLAEIELGITVGYGSIEKTQLSDCDLTIPVKVYYGNDYYTYCCDFKLSRDKYIMFRTEYLYRTRYIY